MSSNFRKISSQPIAQYYPPSDSYSPADLRLDPASDALLVTVVGNSITPTSPSYVTPAQSVITPNTATAVSSDTSILSVEIYCPVANTKPLLVGDSNGQAREILTGDSEVFSAPAGSYLAGDAYWVKNQVTGEKAVITIVS